MYIIRVDASHSIGLGHLSRCLLLGNFIKKKNKKVIFLTEQSLSQKIIESEGHICLRLNSKLPDLLELYGPYTLIADINSEKIFSSNLDYTKYLDDLRVNAKALIIFDDLVDYPYCADIVIIPYCGANNLKLNKESNTKYLLGPSYFPLRHEFYNTEFNVSVRAKKILITMGGSDPEKITLKALNAIRKIEDNFKIVILLGKASKIIESEIYNVLSNYNGSYKIIKDSKNISKLMKDSDIAITNSGLTKYELSAVGVPSIIISNNKKHSKFTESFSKNECAIHVGNASSVSDKKIRENCINLLGNYKLRFNMSLKGRRLVDANGMSRIWKEISNF